MTNLITIMTLTTTSNRSMMHRLLLLWPLSLFLSSLFQLPSHNNNGVFFVSSFVPLIPVHDGPRVGVTMTIKKRNTLVQPLNIATTDDDDVSKSDSTSSSTKSQSSKTRTNTNVDAKLFPVLKQLDGINWEGSCRYVNEQLIPSHNLKLYGGIQFDLTYGVEGDSNNQHEIEMNSFLLFPNGNRRDIEMRYVTVRTYVRSDIYIYIYIHTYVYIY